MKISQESESMNSLNTTPPVGESEDKKHDEQKLSEPLARSLGTFDWHGAAELTFYDDIVGPSQGIATS